MQNNQLFYEVTCSSRRSLLGTPSSRGFLFPIECDRYLPNMIQMLKSKIHGVTATGADLEYEGSIAIDQSLMEMAGIIEFEKVAVWNKTNGNRHETYAIKAPPGSGEITVNGAASHLVKAGDELIIASFMYVDTKDVPHHKPTIVLITDKKKNKGHLK